VHPRLIALFAALSGHGVVWTLLRVPRNPELPPGDVDLLVRPEDLTAFDAVARDAGFVALPGWDAPPSLLYFALDEDAGRFVVLDVADRVVFGARDQYPTSVAAGVLDRRVPDGDAFRPAPDDEFWLLLLHCLLDKGTVPDHYRDRLEAGARSASTDSALPKFLAAIQVDVDALRSAAARGDWSALLAQAAPLAAAWTHSVPRMERAAQRWRRLRRVLGRPALLPRRRGITVALLGPNGAGKSTLAHGIGESFPLPVAQIYMGLWKTGASEPTALRQLADAAARPFRAWGRLARAMGHQAQGHLVVFDRYVDDARRPAAPPLRAVKRIYFWLLSRAVPRPDVSLLLDLPAAVAHGRKAENSLAETEVERTEYLALRAQLPLHVLDASRPAAEVRGQALAVVWRAYRSRFARVELPAPAREPVEPRP
jgi:thymidylate kinase